MLESLTEFDSIDKPSQPVVVFVAVNLILLDEAPLAIIFPFTVKRYFPVNRTFVPAAIVTVTPLAIVLLQFI